MGKGGAHHDEKIMVDPDLHMAALVSRSIGHTVTREQVRDLFRLHWSRLSLLAHAIHDQQKQES